MQSPSVYDHLRPVDASQPDGVYRVVGTGDASVTLLRVGDADGQRVNTGDIHTVAREDLDGFEPATNPDGNRPLADRATGRLTNLYWVLRSFGQQLAAHPVVTATLVALLIAGNLTERVAALPDPVPTLLVILAGLGLGVVGSGRL